MAKFKIYAQNLNDFLERAAGRALFSIDKAKNIQPIFSSCVLEVSKDKLKITGNDAEQIVHAEARYEGDDLAVETEGEIGIADIEALSKIVKSFKKKLVTVEYPFENVFCSISDDHDRIKVSTVKPEDVTSRPPDKFRAEIDLFKSEPKFGPEDKGVPKIPIKNAFKFKVDDLSSLPSDAVDIVGNSKLQVRISQQGMEIEISKHGAQAHVLRAYDITWMTDPIQFGEVFSFGFYAAIEYLKGEAECWIFGDGSNRLLFRDAGSAYIVSPVEL